MHRFIMDHCTVFDRQLDPVHRKDIILRKNVNYAKKVTTAYYTQVQARGDIQKENVKKHFNENYIKLMRLLLK